MYALLRAVFHVSADEFLDMTPDHAQLLLGNLPIAAPMSSEMGNLEKAYPPKPKRVQYQEIVRQRDRQGMAVPDELRAKAEMSG
jgi:hypothetical protein